MAGFSSCSCLLNVGGILFFNSCDSLLLFISGQRLLTFDAVHKPSPITPAAPTSPVLQLYAHQCGRQSPWLSSHHCNLTSPGHESHSLFIFPHLPTCPFLPMSPPSSQLGGVKILESSFSLFISTLYQPSSQCPLGKFLLIFEL